jgi:hypothetical protein
MQAYTDTQADLGRALEKRKRTIEILSNKALNVWQRSYLLDELETEFPDIRLPMRVLNAELKPKITAPAEVKPQKIEPVKNSFTYLNRNDNQSAAGAENAKIDSNGAFSNANNSDIVNFFVYGIGNASNKSAPTYSPSPTESPEPKSTLPPTPDPTRPPTPTATEPPAPREPQPGPAHEDVSNTTTDNSTKDSKPEEKSNEKPIDSNTSDIVLTPNLFEKIGRMYMEASEDRINQAQQMVSLWSVPLDLVLEGVNYVADITNGETPQMHLRWDEESGFVTDLSYVDLVKRNLQNNINNGVYPITGNKESEQAIVDALDDPVFGAIVNLIGEGIIDPMNYATGAAIKKISALSRAGKIEEAEKLAQELVTDAVPDYMAPRRMNTGDIKYKPSSGAILKATPGKTTTIIGNYENDMKKILDETGNVKTTNYGPNEGGFNILNVPESEYRGLTGDQFWERHNKPWLDNVIARGDTIVLATKPTLDVRYKYNFSTGKLELTGFGREYEYLYARGYVLDESTMTMVRKK